MKKNEPALLVLQSTQRTTDQIVNAAKAYANIRCQFEAKLRKTLAGANYLRSLPLCEWPHLESAPALRHVWAYGSH